MSEWTRSLTGRSRVRSDRPSRSHRRRQAAERDGCADIEHPLDLLARNSERRGSVSHAVEPLAIHADARVRPNAKRRAAAGGPLGGDEPLVGVWVAARERGGEVGALHRTDQASLL